MKDRVQVHAGEEFWSWINNGEKHTQEWVLAGILNALGKSNIRSKNKALLVSFETAVAKKMGIDSKKKITIENNGDVLVNNEKVFHYIYNSGKGIDTCKYPGWLTDSNHFIIQCGGEIRIVETDTKKVAVIDNGGSAQWFGQSFEEF